MSRAPNLLLGASMEDGDLVFDTELKMVRRRKDGMKRKTGVI